MDTWMGINHDPQTLHKYMYTHGDPVNNTDPTGNYTLSGLSTAISIRGILTVASRTHAGMSWMDTIINGDPANFDAKAVGATIILSMIGGSVAQKVFGLFAKRSKGLVTNCATNSFTGTTLISAEFGLVPISSISIGDRVWSFNEESQEVSLQEVIHIIHGEGLKKMVDIELSTGEVVASTNGHPFYSHNKWVDAGLLNLDDVLTSIDNNYVSVASLYSYELDEPVFNLTVSKDHTYYVGDQQVLVHNCYFKPGWTAHGNKHIPRKNLSSAQVRASTKNGPAKYYIRKQSDVREFELNAWARGIPTTNGKKWKVAEFPDVVGAKNGKDVRWIRLEYSEGGDVIHGHPITLDEFRKLIR